jgi:type I restriction enzyme S subunit
VATAKTGRKPNDILESGRYEYINAGTTNSGYVQEFNCNGDVVTTPSRGQGGIGYVGYQPTAFWLGPLCYGIKANDSRILSNKFLYYVLCGKTDDILKRRKEGGTPALNASDLLTIKVPVPPLDVQQRIVHVLDNFDAICSDLNIGLPAEIEARQKQYEYYRDKLLTFQAQ